MNAVLEFLARVLNLATFGAAGLWTWLILARNRRAQRDAAAMRQVGERLRRAAQPPGTTPRP